ncbi:MAG: electron transfer flavoprotein subunit alpha/FixB family protein [Pseudonocardiales bacterium]|nr:electron transfer flavoprotein subunit alpha/FixB family protein [Pseudonocardiales bacterium]MBV9728080.1 electron transfer flavoprotein subunit alpha/FixB family protein [Pseudonocardiales bacterium]
MAEVLVLVEHAGGEVKKVTNELLTAAARLGEPAAVVVATSGTAGKLRDRLAAYGAAKIYVAESEEVDQYLTAPAVGVLAALVASVRPSAVLLAASPDGKEIAGKLAVRTGSGLLSDVVELAADGTATHSVFGGSYLAKSRATTPVAVITVRAGAIEPRESPGAAAEQTVEIPAVSAARAATIIERRPIEGSDRPELTEANVVVSGGRGVGSADNFGVVEKLADSLGAAVGASRAAVDSGYYPHQFQVGQTGKTVSPQLYVALGISGAIQHRAGMQTSKTIVAVNRDPEAPIFEIADFGVVGDLFTIAPQLTDAVTKRKG